MGSRNHLEVRPPRLPSPLTRNPIPALADPSTSRDLPEVVAVDVPAGILSLARIRGQNVGSESTPPNERDGLLIFNRAGDSSGFAVPLFGKL
jgi:hypothetical protein